jgi:hypothetical protein
VSQRRDEGSPLNEGKDQKKKHACDYGHALYVEKVQQGDGNRVAKYAGGQNKKQEKDDISGRRMELCDGSR